MKQLPTGIQSLHKILNDNGLLYVDKTHYIKQLIDKGSPHYFMSRPRRFGKSLFVSTLEEIFEGNRDLFKGLAIYNSDYTWAKYPVLHLDFSLIEDQTPEAFRDGLLDMLEDFATQHKLKVTGSSLQSTLMRLIKALAEKYNRVVILVDEYDKPIINHLTNLTIANQNRDLLRDFFGTLKGLDAYIKFTFITGVSKFSQVSLFSGPNYLTDITMEPEYATMMGYTEEEIQFYFKPYVHRIAQDQNRTENQIFEELKAWYNGYFFARDSKSVYNPYSTLNYMERGAAESYWYRSGTPSFLIDQVKKHPQSVVPLSGATALKSTLSDINNFERINLTALMFQTGYLTISGHDKENDVYHLDFPNKEVRSAFFNSLVEDFAEVDPTLVITQSKYLRTTLENHHINEFIQIINSYFAKVPYELFIKAQESFYHALFLTFLERSGIHTMAEVSTNIGRIDLVAHVSNITYVFELKLNKSADAALDQAQTNRYKERFSRGKNTTIVIGINFSSTQRNIADWKAKHFSPLGKLLSASSKKTSPTAL